jgi:uncharacterized protein (DUF1330 family)
MAAYLVAQVRIEDSETYDRYRAAVPALVERFGGRFLARGGALEVLEGAWPLPRLVIIEFPSRDAARRFYDSPEYQQILPLRQQASQGNVVLVEGV